MAFTPSKEEVKVDPGFETQIQNILAIPLGTEMTLLNKEGEIEQVTPLTEDIRQEMIRNVQVQRQSDVPCSTGGTSFCANHYWYCCEPNHTNGMTCTVVGLCGGISN